MEINEVVDVIDNDDPARWEDWIKHQISLLLDVFINASVKVNTNVKYFPHVVEVQESGEVIDESKSDSALLSLHFIFEKPIDRNKPIDEYTQE